MQIILTKNEVEEAVRAMILDRVSLLIDQVVTVEADSDEEGIFATVTIETPAVKAEEAAPRKARAAAKTDKDAPAKKPAAPVTAPAPKPVPAKTKPEVTEEETPAKSDVPFDVDEQPANISTTPEDRKEPETVTASASPATPSAIFPNAISSAPATPPPLPAAGPKSLFANLTKPVNAK